MTSVTSTAAVDKVTNPDRESSAATSSASADNEVFRTTIDCYAVFDRFFPTCGMTDYTEGIYHGDPLVPYALAQRNQINYVLDEAQCERGTRLLEIGCGNGNLLATARERGAQAVGITITPAQVAFCRRRNLDVRLLNYRHLGEEYIGRYDTVVANGPIEHFVQAEEAAAGLEDSIYRQFFQLCHRAIDPRSPVKRFVNTTIHFARRPDPRDLLQSPWRFPRGSDSYHYAWLHRSFGGWYPAPGQLERCAGDRFRLVKTVDGTFDYHLTSEHWLQRMQAALRSTEAVRIFWKALPLLLTHGRQLSTMLYAMLVSQSWNWQFRTADPPTRLLRQSWEYVAP